MSFYKCSTFTCNFDHHANIFVIYLGNAEVIVAVFGPVEVRMNKEMIDRATVECNFRTKSGLPGKNMLLMLSYWVLYHLDNIC